MGVLQMVVVNWVTASRYLANIWQRFGETRSFLERRRYRLLQKTFV